MVRVLFIVPCRGSVSHLLMPCNSGERRSIREHPRTNSSSGTAITFASITAKLVELQNSFLRLLVYIGKGGNYDPYACAKIINSTPAVGAHSGCPFKTLPESQLIEHLVQMQIPTG